MEMDENESAIAVHTLSMKFVTPRLTVTLSITNSLQ